MKVVILGDTHFGVRQGSKVFIDFQAKFYKFLFEYIDKHNLTTMIQLGDEFDHPQRTSHLAMFHAKEMFFDEIRNRQMDYHTIIGNHDIMYKNTLSINSPSLFLKEYNFNIIEKPCTITIGDTYFCMIPWICADNMDDSYKEIKTSKADVCIGHFEINGFEMHAGQVCVNGIDSTIFKKYQTVLSGHYHHKSKRGNIQYVGTPYELTWHDYGDSKGFYVFDTITHGMEFVENPYRMFHKIEYEKGAVIPDVTGAIVRVVVKEKDDAYDEFIKNLNNQSCFDVKVIENMGDVHNAEALDENLDISDTPSILKNYVDKLEIENKTAVNSLIHSLYIEALNEE